MFPIVSLKRPRPVHGHRRVSHSSRRDEFQVRRVEATNSPIVHPLWVVQNVGADPIWLTTLPSDDRGRSPARSCIQIALRSTPIEQESNQAIAKSESTTVPPEGRRDQGVL